MLFYMRIFGSKQSFRIGVFVTMTIVWMWSASVILETFLLCRPLAYNWDTTIDGSCGERNATYVVAGTLNLITDLMVMVLPLPHIWKLQLNVAKKVALLSVFCIGLLYVSSREQHNGTPSIADSDLLSNSVSIISIIRLKSLMEIDFENITKSVQMGVMWTIIEPELAIICANMPLLKTILARMMPGLFSTPRKNYGVSDPQTFERLQEQQSGQIYPMNRFDHDAVHTNISTTNSTESQRKLSGQQGDAVVTSKRSADDADNNELQFTKRFSSIGINVTQNFDVKYH